MKRGVDLFLFQFWFRFWFWFWLLFGFCLTACNNEDLLPLQALYSADLNYVTVDAHFCTSPPEPSKQKIKYLFILDHSQSNQPGFPNPLTPNDVFSTDPAGNRRYGPLAQFIKTLAPDPNNLTSFALIDFNDTAYQPSGMSGFNSDSTSFLQSLQNDWIGTGTAAQPAPADKGFTNYQAALNLAQQIILADAKTEAANPSTPIITVSYHLVFVSDGIPTVVVSGGSSSVYTQTFTDDILPVIQKINDIKNDPVLSPSISEIQMDTAYYFQTQQIPAAETLLQQMATAGNGQYYQFGAGSGIAYQDLAPPSRKVKYELNDIWVDNKNAVWWDDGRFLRDSGGSGMPDAIRVPLGGILNQQDSDGNGVSDLVEYRTKGKICNDPQCNPSGRDPYAVCSGLSPTIGPDGTLSYPSTSNSGFNDCEAFILGTNSNTFSTNGSFISDFLAFKNTLPILAGTDGSQWDPFGDGVTNYQKLKLGLPLSISKNKISDFQTRTTTLIREDSPDLTTDCYHLVVDQVAVLGDNNQIQVSVIENATVLDDKPVLKSATHTVQGQSSPVSFVQEDFK